MGLSSLHLDAFLAAAQARSFSQASTALHITQSALSQRIKALEEDLDLTLFIRMPRGVQLTDAGNRLLRYCQVRQALEEELVQELAGESTAGLGGQVRIGGYSSVVRSVILPALAPFLRKNPHVQPHIQNAEMRDLPDLLLSGSVDFIVMDRAFHRTDVDSVALGEEEYVMVESRLHPLSSERENVYIDHDPGDHTSAELLRLQPGPLPKIRRAYLDETYAIIDGVAAGIGRAVLSRHLIVGDDRIQVVPNHKPMRVAVTLYYFRQPFYPALHKAILATLTEHCPPLLAARA
ncbi:MAG TPA: LysR family transcriptional regulator [Kofleriaceae bacterium]|nr:LysR family transcriptional regulator [Kofleriaceae bacterium]